MKNYVYELNNWYEVLDIDTSNKECSYGLNLFLSFANVFSFGEKVFECYVPLKNNKIKIFGDQLRCQKFYLTDITPSELINYENLWTCVSPKMDNKVFIGNISCFSLFDYKKYWSKLDKSQRKDVILYNPNFDFKEYWKELTEEEKEIIMRTKILRYTQEEICQKE
jgi:hypothetical protein